MQIQGYFDLRFEALKDAFAELFDDPQERGAALCVQVGGETVVDIWAGTADKDAAQAWHSDTILNLFSCTKTFAAVAALQLVEQGKLELDAPVARWWLEFAAAGKERVTLRQLLCHRAGLPALHAPLPAEALYDWAQMTSALAAELNVSLIGRARGQRVVIGRDYAEETLSVAGRSFRYRQPEGAFTQPNGEVCQKMLNWAYEVMGERNDDLLELYCGNGNFTLPLATRARRALATEISKSSVNAALHNLADNGISNTTLVRLSAEELTQALNGVRPFRRLAGVDLPSYEFGTVFVDPPRAGMDDDTCRLVQRFPRILYISCNPETLAQNLTLLSETHKVTRAALFDQFPYTHHMESGVLLERR